MASYLLPHLKLLESDSIFILREAASQFTKPVLLYSIGKDSSVLLRLAEKAFAPGKIPFPLLHIDTGKKFAEMYSFRDATLKTHGIKLLIRRNEAAIKEGAHPATWGITRYTHALKTIPLLEALKSEQFDAAIGGARREEERSRAKERVFSFRNENNQWEPRAQRPEMWNLVNTRIKPGESFRVFPLSNWTELDIWSYIHQEKIDVVPLYFAKEREVIIRGKQIFLNDGHTPLDPGEKPATALCRFRTLGCSPCTGAVRSSADTVEKIIEELLSARQSERALRTIDFDSDGSMEIKKREGYF